MKTMYAFKNKAANALLRIHMREKISMEVKVPVKRDPEQRMPLRLKL